MMGLALLPLLLVQGPSDDVGRLVREGAFMEALAVAEAVEGAEGALLVAWTRHQAGDLRGALQEVRVGLRNDPGDSLLLEQGSYLATSLLLGEEGLRYAEELSSLGHPGARVLVRDAQAVQDARDEVVRSTNLAMWIICISLAVFVVLGRYGLRGENAGAPTG